jgi:D-alanyl-D-alanine carboxypeptidase
MLRRGAFVQRALRWSALGLATLLAVTAVSSNADARGRRKKQRPTAAQSYQPAPASIVVDANSGAVLQATNADSPRHPASLTKIMTLYLLFERLEAGKIKLTSELPVSPHAAAQAPSKLALKPGETIRVETAIRAIVTKSANDVAVIVAEALGGDEPGFARMMTAKARALGMKQTTYRNASGLPDDEQITTARDQATLGRAIQDRFPSYYAYFSTRTFEFRGRAMRNHNHLLGRVTGVDGIKTGYIRASGFNIVTSVRRDNRHVVAVVFGGSTAKVRDARVVNLINGNIAMASAKRTAPPIAEGVEIAEARPRDSKEANKEAIKEAAKDTIKEMIKEPVKEVVREKIAAAPLAAPAETAQPTPGSTDPIKPNTVKTFTVHPGAVRTASLSPLPPDSRKLMPAPATANVASVTNIVTTKGEAAPLPPPGARPGVLGVLSTKVASAGDSVPVTAAVQEPAPSSKARGGWMIQVGAFDEESEAKNRLSTCQSKAKDQLSKADPFTERVAKGDKALYRARFAGLEKDQAEAACKSLKRSEIPCMLLKN